MGGIRAEPRTVLIAQVQVSWEEQDGPHLDVRGKMEDTSPSGASIRLKMPIGVGAKVKIKSHREDFSGITRYCRREAGDYVLGIQREIKVQAKAKAVAATLIQGISVSNPAVSDPRRKETESVPVFGIADRTEITSPVLAVTEPQTPVAKADRIRELNVHAIPEPKLPKPAGPIFRHCILRRSKKGKVCQPNGSIWR